MTLDDYLAQQGINLDIKQDGHGYAVFDAKHKRPQYKVCLTREGRKRFTYPFWDGVGQPFEAAKVRRAIQSCLRADLGIPDTFEEFCAEYGYRAEERESRAAFKRCEDWIKRAKRFFTSDEIESIRSAEFQSIDE